MKAFRVYLDNTDLDYIGSVVERLNSYDDIIATVVDTQELFVAAVGQFAVNYAAATVNTSFGGKVSIKYVKQ